MPGIAGVIGTRFDAVAPSAIEGSVNLAGTATVHSERIRAGLLTAAWLPSAPLTGARWHRDPGRVLLFHGELAGFSSIPHAEILECASLDSYEWFADLLGTYAVALYEERNDGARLSLVGDRVSQEPIYFAIEPGAVAFSTSLATFPRLGRPWTFDESWLFKLLFFNFPVGTTTPLRNVQRVPPASVVTIDIDRGTHEIRSYAHRFRRNSYLLRGRSGLEHAFETFADVVPPYFRRGRVAAPLTSGYDSRALLSLAPEDAEILLYTYGLPGSLDMQEGKRLSRHFEWPHYPLEFDRTFSSRLQDLTTRTVYLSGGLQGTARATLPFVYQQLMDAEPDTSAVLSGVSGGHLFAGAGNVPAVISPGVADLLRGTTGEQAVTAPRFRKLLGDRFADFAHCILDAVAELEQSFAAPLGSTEGHLLYNVYEVAPKYFAGEAAIANTVASYRCPYWDPRLIALAFEVEASTLTSSRFASSRGPHPGRSVHSFVLLKNEKLARHLVRGQAPGDAFRSRWATRPLARRAAWAAKRAWRKALREPPLEDWSKWYAAGLAGTVHRTFFGSSMLADHLDRAAIVEAMRTGGLHITRQLLSIELILRLLDNGWDLRELERRDAGRA